MKIVGITIASTLLIFNSIIYADGVLSKEHPIVNAFVKQYKGSRTFAQNRELTKDACFIDANKFIYDISWQSNITIMEGDSHDPKNQKKVSAKAPNYKDAVKTLEECVKKTNNPVAAWEGLFIINSYLGLDFKNNTEAYKLFSEVLYADRNCDGYLNYGDMFLKGISIKPDKNKALEIYKAGAEVCSSDGGWHKIVFEMRIGNLKKAK